MKKIYFLAILLLFISNAELSAQCTDSLLSPIGTDNQTLCINTPIDTIRYKTTGATGATFSNLPNGTNGTWNNDTIKITGTANTSGIFNYTITLTGGPCTTESITGTINVEPANTISLTSATSTVNQGVCVNTPIVTTTYATTGATGATVTGLPGGVTGSWAADTVTISGTPNATGTFTYTIELTGGCGTTTAQGTLTISAANTITLISASGTNDQSVCVNSSITTIKYATAGATGANITGLPTGVTGSWAADTITIVGAPSVEGSFDYTINLTGGCGSTMVQGNITVTPGNTITLTSGATTNNQAVCVNIPVENITYATTGATGATITGLPTGVTGNWSAGVVTISGTPSVAGTFLYTITLTGGCGSTQVQGSITVTAGNSAVLTSGANTNAQTVCRNTPITNITYATAGATGATFSGLPAGVSGFWVADTVTIIGTPVNAGNFSYTVTLTGGCGTAMVQGNITVTAANTINLTSSTNSNAQTVCVNTPISNITYSTTGATNATVTGLPAGVSGTWNNNQVIISGTPASSIGTFYYTVTLIGGCGTTATSGTITVIVSNTIDLTSAIGTNAQSVCINTPITNITYSTTGATGAMFAGLPTGVTGNWLASSNTAIISGTPSISGTFSYTITLTGGCGNVTTTGTIAVTLGNTVTLTSAANTEIQSVCANTPIMNITYATTGANGATVTGLPAGVSGNWLANQVTISGTPTVLGNFAYTVTLTGGCGAVTATGSISVSQLNTITLTSAPTTATQTICENSPITNITYATTGATGATASNLPTGVTGSWSSNVFTITGTPTVPGNYNYTVNLNGGCGTVGANGTINVNLTPEAAHTPLQTICSGSAIGQIVPGNTPGVVYTWTRNNLSSATGIGANGSGNINGSLTNTTNAPVMVIFTITPKYTNSGLTCTGSSVQDTVIVNPVPQASASPASQTICSGSAVASIALNSNVAGTQYSWVRDNTTAVTGIPSSGTGNISGTLTNTTPVPVTVTFTVTPSYTNAGVTCTASTFFVTVVVNPIPSVAATPTSQTICSGSAIATIGLTGSATNTVYSWTRDNATLATGIAASGTGNIDGSLTNSTGAPVTVTFTITPRLTNSITCTGSPITATVVVNPLPNVAPLPSSQTICSGSSIATIALTGSVAGTVYNWTRDNTATVTGIATSGIGNITGGLTNTTNAPVTVSFVITPTYTNAGTTCTGPSSTVTVVVNPVPNAVATPASQSICGGSSVSPIVLSGNVVGATYNWTRDNTTIATGIGSSGTGNISGILNDTTIAPVTVTFTIIPTYTNAGNICTGTPITATATVNPIPNVVSAPTQQTICSGSSISPIVLTGKVPNTIYNWTRDNTGSATGIGSNGAGNISGSLTNTTNTPVTVNFTLTPTYTNAGTSCTGTPGLAKVVVNPIPVATATPVSQSICSGSAITTIALSSNVAGITLFNWTRNNTAFVTGMPSTATGDISGVLTNTGSQPVNVNFTITPTYTNEGISCPGNTITSTVTVNPTPVINPINNYTYCNKDSSQGFNFTSNSPDSSFTWKSTPNIGFGTNGSGFIAPFIASNTGNIPLVATVTVSVTASNDRCKGPDRSFTVTVNPSPAKPNFTSLSQYPNADTLTLCSGSNNINFNITQPTAGVSYLWSSNSANVSIRDKNDANTVISFQNTGIYPVKVLATNSLFGCNDTVTQIVRVTATPGINEREIIIKQPGNLLFYPDNSLNPVNGYQWGYDSLLRVSPDSAYSLPKSLTGQVYQFFIPENRFIKNNQLDTVNYSYWVLLQQGNCFSRVYYNGPYARGRIPLPLPENNAVRVRVFPNPNNGAFDISLNGNIYGSMNITVYNSYGQVVFRSKFSKATPNIYERISALQLPNGVYNLVINSSDLKRAETRFIIQR